MNLVLQNPANTQNYNRYSYCLNNPLKYVDPSGHVFLDPWYEYMAGPKSFRTWLREDIAEYTDDAGRKWKNIGNNINLMDFINPNKSVFLMKLKEDTEFDGYIKMLKEKYPDLKLDEDMVWGFNGMGNEDKTQNNNKLSEGDNRDYSRTAKYSQKFLQSPGLEFEQYSTNLIYKGQSSIETVINGESLEIESINIHTKLGCASFGNDGTLTYGNDFFSFGTNNRGLYVFDFSIPQNDKNSLGITLYFNTNELNQGFNNFMGRVIMSSKNTWKYFIMPSIPSAMPVFIY